MVKEMKGRNTSPLWLLAYLQASFKAEFSEASLKKQFSGQFCSGVLVGQL